MAVLVILAEAVRRGFVRGHAGFGTVPGALGFWLHVIDPTLVAVCSVVAQSQTLSTIWHAIDHRRV